MEVITESGSQLEPVERQVQCEQLSLEGLEGRTSGRVLDVVRVLLDRTELQHNTTSSVSKRPELASYESD